MMTTTTTAILLFYIMIKFEFVFKFGFRSAMCLPKWLINGQKLITVEQLVANCAVYTKPDDNCSSWQLINHFADYLHSAFNRNYAALNDFMAILLAKKWKYKNLIIYKHLIVYAKRKNRQRMKPEKNTIKWKNCIWLLNKKLKFSINWSIKKWNYKNHFIFDFS